MGTHSHDLEHLLEIRAHVDKHKLDTPCSDSRVDRALDPNRMRHEIPEPYGPGFHAILSAPGPAGRHKNCRGCEAAGSDANPVVLAPEGRHINSSDQADRGTGRCCDACPPFHCCYALKDG